MRNAVNFVHLHAEVLSLGSKVVMEEGVATLVVENEFTAKIKDGKRPSGMTREPLVRRDRFFHLRYDPEIQDIRHTLRIYKNGELEDDLSARRKIILVVSMHDNEVNGWGWYDEYKVEEEKMKLDLKRRRRKRELADQSK